MKPMNMKDILTHQKIYTQKIYQQRQLRNLKGRQLLHQWDQYHPPQYVAKSYLLSLEEQSLQRKKSEEKIQIRLLGQLKKRRLQQSIKQMQRHSNSKSRKIKSLSSQKQIQKQQITPQLKILLGNHYMHQVRKRLNKNKKSNKLVTSFEQNQLQISNKRTLKTQTQLDNIKQKRISNLQIIRNKRIQQITNSPIIDYQKIQKLKYQANKFDIMAKNKLDIDKRRKTESIEGIHQRNQSATIMLASIKAKLAILKITSKKK